MSPRAVFLLDTALRPYRKVIARRWLIRKTKQILRGEGPAVAAAASAGLRKRFEATVPGTAMHAVREATETELYNNLGRAGSLAYQGPSKPLSSAIILIRSTDRADLGEGTWRVDYDLGWGRCRGLNMSIVPVPGDHNSLLNEENARRVAEGMRPHLAGV